MKTFCRTRSVLGLSLVIVGKEESTPTKMTIFKYLFFDVGPK